MRRFFILLYWLAVVLAAGCGGVKESGYGRDGSAYALEDYTSIKHVMVSTG